MDSDVPNRPLISYDELSPPLTEPGPSKAAAGISPIKHAQNQSKKRKRSNKSRQIAHRNDALAHWDEPASPEQSVNHGDNDVEDDTGDGLEEWEESRELTHEEIWDDSALINAWNAATEEYKAYHGPSKAWKKEPVHKSPLWWNVPPPESKKKGDGKSSLLYTSTSNGHEEPDSHPLTFDTFVPTHDPSLKVPNDVKPAALPTSRHASPAYHPDSEGLLVSQDEAFNRAMDAMYWSGYWTATYHLQRHLTQIQSAGCHDPNGFEAAGDGENEEEGMMTTQR